MANSFGKFELIRKIATGGMGEVFLARHQGASGAQKLLVIKRILPHLVENEEFVRLFRDEARIAAHLNHPNIARLYEVGEIDGAWYLALEHVDGPDLRRLGQQARASQRPVPLPVTCRIIADTAAALHYAHRARDSSGKPLEIVHRDVSPHNILVGMDGRVKLIDFGIARATNRLEHTATGMVRGKYSYMSPEHLVGGVVDARADIFALGVVLWEVLAGERLFHAESDLAVIKLVAKCRVAAPSSLNSLVPQALDAVCLKALQLEPAARFPDADAMRRALESVFAGDEEQVGVAQVAAMMRDLFAKPPPATELNAPTRSHSGDFVETFLPLEPAPRERSSEQTILEGAAARELDPAKLDDGEPFDAPLLEPAPAEVKLPTPRSPFVGRAKEILRLSSYFLCGGRLVTILGPAGTGKTRLALEYAARSLKAEVPANTGGVLFCPLAEARDVGGICAELARALDIDLAGPDADAEVRQVGAALATRGEVLMVLDGFEQVAKFAPQTVGHWLTLAPSARLLVTSRAMLSLGTELMAELGPLDAEGEALLTAAASPGTRPPATGELLRRAGRLPQALELVAGQTWAFSAESVAERLPDRAAAGPARPFTAAAAAEWAYALLPAAERLALARCSVFRGDFSREAAAAVLCPADDAEGPAFGEVEALERKRLLQAVLPARAPLEERLSLHESLRELGANQLRALGQEAQTRARHARYFLSLAGAAQAGLEGPDAATARARLSRERENLLAVFRYALEDRRAAPTDGLLLASLVALEPLLSTEGPPALHLGMLELVLERLEASSAVLEPLQLGKALLARGLLLRAAGRVAEANVDLNEAAGLAQRLGDATLEARVRLELSAGHTARGRSDAARHELDRVLELDPPSAGLRVRALVGLGTLALDARDAELAARHLSRARSIADEGGDVGAQGAVHLAQHDLALLGGHGERAVAELERALTAFRQARLGAAEGRALLGLAAHYRERTLPSEASQYYRAAVARFASAGQVRLVAQALADLCGMEQEQRQWLNALARCRQALAAASTADDRQLKGVLLARLGSLLAVLNRPAEADAALAAAEVQLRPLGVPALETLLSVHRAHAQLCRPGGGEPGRGATVRALLAEAERPSEASLRRAGAPSDPLRDAARILRAALGSGAEADAR